MDNISIFSIAVSQVSQIGLSACGATAVINALLALDSSHTTATVAEQGRISDNIHVEIEKGKCRRNLLLDLQGYSYGQTHDFD